MQEYILVLDRLSTRSFLYENKIFRPLWNARIQKHKNRDGLIGKFSGGCDLLVMFLQNFCGGILM
jgi:hypothetical protein